MASEFNGMEDLIFSRSFRNWVLNRDPPEKSFWENWMQRNPDKAEVVKYAKAVIYALYLDRAVLSAEEVDEEVRKALVRLKEAPRYIPLEGPEGRDRRWRQALWLRRVWVAVILAAVIGSAGLLVYRMWSRRDGLQTFLASHKREPVREQETDAAGGKTVNLPDGTQVRLGKSSKLYFTSLPGRTQREVFLEGEAFFDVRKNAAAPFYVYTGQVVIKVLGTSFVVHSFPADVRTTVTVVMGKVSVYRQEDFAQQAGGRNEPAGIVLTPNQEADCDRGEDRLHKTLAEAPVALGEKVDGGKVEGRTGDTALSFQRAPISQVFAQLQELYGIPIQFDKEALDSCYLTAMMDKGSYYEKLDIVCKAIGGAYEVIDGNIVVTALGCQR
ncbi:MAG TPA: FecR family protein [Puia sp.]|nr:FecR family protein [Puia sp.]